MDIKTGLICIGLEGERLDLAKQFHRHALEALEARGIEVVNPGDTYTLSSAQAVGQAKACRDAGADSIIYLIGTWVLANHVVDAIQQTGLPVGIWGMPEAASFSSVGANVVHGSLKEMGIRHNLFYGLPDDKETVRDILAFTRACMVSQRMLGARFGMIGGRTINAYPTSGDFTQIKALFGVEMEHIDQMVLLEKARGVERAQARAVVDQLKESYGSVDVDEEILIKSANNYIALKQIKEENELDLCSVKCIGEYMETYTSCCMAVALLNDAGYVTGCQCSVNAGLSSYILSLMAGEPSFFGDVNMVDVKTRVARLINCGVLPTKLAKSYDNVKWVEQYEYMGAGRGACALFCCKPGDVTFGTLGRIDGEYVMNIARGEAFEEELDVLTSVRTWAQGFVKLDGDPRVFYDNILSNHSAMAYGDYERELLAFCELKGIRAMRNV